MGEDRGERGMGGAERNTRGREVSEELKGRIER